MTEKEKSQDWIINEEHEYLQSNLLLKNGFQHAFFTRKVDSLKPSQLIKDLDRKVSIHQIQQIHGDKVVDSKDAIKPPWPKADGIISLKEKNESLWIYSADCIPALIGDKKTGRVAACHAGWRGICNKILIKTINKMELLGSCKKDLIIAFGPSISIEKYQIGKEIIKIIFNSLNINPSYDITEEKNITKELLKKKIIRKDILADKFLLDLKQAGLTQLSSLGLKESQLSINMNCTFSDESLFFSWRRSKIKARQWSYIICN